MSSSTTSSAPRARSPSCCSLACSRSSSPSAASSRSIAYWGRNDAIVARPDRPLCDQRAGAGLPDPAGADYRADLLLQRALPDLPAAVVLAALVSAVFLQRSLDAGDAGDADGGTPDGGDRDAARRLRRLCHQPVEAAHHA